MMNNIDDIKETLRYIIKEQTWGPDDDLVGPFEKWQIEQVLNELDLMKTFMKRRTLDGRFTELEVYEQNRDTWPRGTQYE